mgnify:CR=1 FL=1
MRLTIILILLLLVVSACKKDRLKDEKSILIGKWNWSYSEHKYGWCDGDDFEETIDPESEGESFSIEFLENGKINFFGIDDQLIEKKRIVFSHFTEESSEQYIFNIMLNNKDSDNLGGRVSNVLILEQFPFTSTPGCEDYDNYFIKE